MAFVRPNSNLCIECPNCKKLGNGEITYHETGMSFGFNPRYNHLRGCYACPHCHQGFSVWACLHCGNCWIGDINSPPNIECCGNALEAVEAKIVKGGLWAFWNMVSLSAGDPIRPMNWQP